MYTDREETPVLCVKPTARSFVLLFSLSFVGAVNLYPQCPDTGQSKVFQSKAGKGFYVYEFLGESSFQYFLEGTNFSFNDKDNPGKTYIFVDKMAYEPLLIERAQLQEYTKSSKAIDILAAQAKYEQGYFKRTDPSMSITDYGPASMKNPDGSDGRLFYLWKKESAPGKTAATQYLVSTMINDRLFVMSFMPKEGSIPEDEMMRQIQSYTSHFDLVSGTECAQVLGPSTSH